MNRSVAGRLDGSHIDAPGGAPREALAPAPASDEARLGRSAATGALSAADVLRLQWRVGNKAVGALLARTPTEVRNVELRTPPKRPKMRPATERTTSPNMQLAQEIDEVDKLEDDELKGLRRQVATDVAAAANDVETAAREAAAAKKAGKADADAAAGRVWSLQSAHAKLLRKLEAIEYVASWRRLPPLQVDRSRYQDPRRELANRRANFRLEVEERVRKTGSLDDALDGMPADAEEVQAIRKEAAEFAGQFKGRAWDNCERMLVTSQDVMYRTLTSYGLPGQNRRAGRAHQDGQGKDEDARRKGGRRDPEAGPEELDKTSTRRIPRTSAPGW